jgi:hypothetical protein
MRHDNSPPDGGSASDFWKNRANPLVAGQIISCRLRRPGRLVPRRISWFRRAWIGEATSYTSKEPRFTGNSVPDSITGITFRMHARVRRQLADLDREIDRAAENFLRAPSEVLEIVGQKLAAMKRQRGHLQDELEAAELAERPKERACRSRGRGGPPVAFGEDEDMAKAEPAHRREVFFQMVERIDLRCDKIQRVKRTECPLRSGEIHLRIGQDGIFGSVSRGERIRTSDPLLPKERRDERQKA